MKSLLLFFILLSTTLGYAQITITGKVSDADGGLFAATVLVKGTNNTTTTDFDGNYAIEANVGDILVFNHFGYTSQEIVIGNESVINVILIGSNEFILICCTPYTKEKLLLVHGINYETYGFLYENNRSILPLGIRFNGGYATDFKNNSNARLGFSKHFKLFNDWITINTGFQTTDFNSHQFHKYEIELQKYIEFNRTINGHISLITGHMNYDHSINDSHNNLGIGVGLEKSISIVTLKANYINWHHFNEVNLKTSINYYNFGLYGSYQHLASYEEFTVGLGYWFHW